MAQAAIATKTKRKRIRITCEVSTTAKLDDLVPFQRKLKKLTRENYIKLKRSLLKYGLSFPFYVWRHDGKTFLLDGHQRDVVLKRLAFQGYEVPPVPIVSVDAKDAQEAQEKILLASSHYGIITNESLLDYVRESDLDLDDIEELVVLPGVNFDKLTEQFDETAEKALAQAGEQFLIIITCKDEPHQQRLLERFEKEKLECRALTS